MESKEQVRQRIWERLERERASRFPGARGRIPNFRGAEQAAARLAELPEWRAARVVKANPDSPQLPVRRRARKEGKTLYMAVPLHIDQVDYDERGQLVMRSHEWHVADAFDLVVNRRASLSGEDA